MKFLLFSVCSTIIGLSLISPISIAASDQKSNNKSDSAQIMVKEEAKKGGQPKEIIRRTDQPLKQRSRATNHMLIYKPPLRGAPAGRVAGGTRGADQGFPYLCLIVPEHVGLTLSSQPVFYFYQSSISPYPIEFTLIKKQGITPLVETRIAPPDKPGIQSVRLADHGVHLKPGIHYKWFIALVPDLHHRSKDILAAGGIELIEPPEKMKDELAAANISQVTHIYAEAGIWYDAFSSLSARIEKSPADRDLRKQRAALLEQIGLHQVARHVIDE